MNQPKKVFCCSNCFQHPWLKQCVAELSKQTGQCDYCEFDPDDEDEQPEVPLVEPGDLSQYFHNMLAMYSNTGNWDFEHGDMLIYRVQGDWNVFDEERLGFKRQCRLLEDIANADWDDDSGEDRVSATELHIVLGGFLHMTHRDRWEEFRYEVREDPAVPIPFDVSEELGKFEVTEPANKTFHRSRRGFSLGEYDERQPFRGADIGAPPVDNATAGRANEQGQRVLYCADQQKTAVAETRSPQGFYVSVATLRLKRDARLLDLTKEHEEINPFITDSLRWEVEIHDLLYAFAEEMSRPLERDDDKTHYVPCQRLAEYVKESHFDGIRYPSALNPEGHNVVFFDPNIVEVGDSKLVHIAKVDFEYEAVETPKYPGTTFTEMELKENPQGVVEEPPS